MNKINTTAYPVAIGGIKPEFFRLPITGHDPYFGLTRSFYYAAEARGWLKLKRLRQKSKLRGVTLVPYQAVKDFLKREEAE